MDQLNFLPKPYVAAFVCTLCIKVACRRFVALAVVVDTFDLLVKVVCVVEFTLQN